MKNLHYIVLLIAGAFSVASCGIYNRYKPKEEVREDLYGKNIQSHMNLLNAASKDSSLLNLKGKGNVVMGDSITNMADIGWKEFFTDPKLQILIERALANNADLRKARLQVEAAEAMVKSARLSYLPNFALAPQGTLSYIDMNSSVTKTYNLPLTASWEIDIFGKLTNQKRSAVMALEQTREYAQAVRCRIVSSVANLYYTIITLDEQLDISLKSLVTSHRSLDLTKELKEAGLATEIAVAQTEAAWRSVQASVSNLKVQRNKSINALLLLLMEVPDTEIDRSSWADQTLPDKMEVGIPIQLLANRPDVRMAEAALAKAFYQTNQARASFYPSIVLSGSAGWTNLVGDVIVNPAEFVANAVASLTQPLFARGKLTAQLRAAKAAQEQAAIDFEYSLLNAGKEVNDAFEGYFSAVANLSVFAEQTKLLAKAVEDTQHMMDYGHLTYLEVLTAQQSYLAAQLSESANKLAVAQGIITLYSALGGGR
ncbi:MAG: TolC family protein [Bacteroidales bacterium]|nr:TolC family protein [Bacteroidales bacterium]